MYFARLSENYMPICDKYFHFVFNITGNISSDFLQKLQMSGEVFFASRAFQGKVYSIRASISPQSPSSLDPASINTPEERAMLVALVEGRLKALNCLCMHDITIQMVPLYSSSNKERMFVPLSLAFSTIKYLS